MTIEISIIVPVYNLEDYLPKCVDSILAQTFTNFELVLVNDGSPDSSGEICDEYASLDNRIKVIHKKNGGVASARNAGLEVAKGKYIGFVDNDDYINEYMFEILYNHAIKHSSDIVICDYLHVSENNPDHTREFDSGIRIQHFNNIEALNQLYTTNNITFVVPWNKLYKRDLFKDVEYKFGSINDDETVAHELLYNSKQTTYIQAGLYYYVRREGSQMNSNFHIKSFDAVYAFKDREIFFRNIREHHLHQRALKHYMDRFFYYYYMAKSTLTDIDKELRDLKHTFDKSLFHLLRHKGIGWKQKIMCVVFSVSPSLYEFIRDFKTERQEQET